MPLEDPRFSERERNVVGLLPDVLVANQFAIGYPELTEKQAYSRYLEEHDAVYKGGWESAVDLTP